MKVVDTNVFIDYLRNYEPALEYLRTRKDKDLYFSAITEAETVSGEDCRVEKKKEKTLRFLHQWEKLPVNNQIAVKAGDIRRENDILLMDSLIAATALNRDAVLVTRNTTDFKEVEELEVERPYI